MGGNLGLSNVHKCSTNADSEPAVSQILLLFLILDPFLLDHNLGGGISRKMSNYILSAFRKARERFGSPCSNIPPQYLQHFFFDPNFLTGGCLAPTDRNCRVCGRIGHWARDCPLSAKNRRTELKQAEAERKQAEKGMKSNFGATANVKPTTSPNVKSVVSPNIKSAVSSNVKPTTSQDVRPAVSSNQNQGGDRFAEEFYKRQASQQVLQPNSSQPSSVGPAKSAGLLVTPAKSVPESQGQGVTIGGRSTDGSESKRSIPSAPVSGTSEYGSTSVAESTENTGTQPIVSAHVSEPLHMAVSVQAPTTPSTASSVQGKPEPSTTPQTAEGSRQELLNTETNRDQVTVPVQQVRIPVSPPHVSYGSNMQGMGASRHLRAPTPMVQTAHPSAPRDPFVFGQPQRFSSAPPPEQWNMLLPTRVRWMGPGMHPSPQHGWHPQHAHIPMGLHSTPGVDAQSPPTVRLQSIPGAYPGSPPVFGPNSSPMPSNFPMQPGSPMAMQAASHRQRSSSESTTTDHSDQLQQIAAGASSLPPQSPPHIFRNTAWPGPASGAFPVDPALVRAAQRPPVPGFFPLSPSASAIRGEHQVLAWQQMQQQQQQQQRQLAGQGALAGFGNHMVSVPYGFYWSGYY